MRGNFAHLIDRCLSDGPEVNFDYFSPGADFVFGMKGMVFNIQRFCINDGPGIRTTVFLKGCPLHCAWCHNPESISPHAEVILREERCIRCGGCVEHCEQHAIVEQNGEFITLRERCIRCGKCMDACYADARGFFGSEMSPEEVIHEIKKDVIFYAFCL